MLDALDKAVTASALIESLERHIPSLMGVEKVPGLALSVIRGGERYWDGTFGLRSRTTQEPVTVDTVFEAASLSKPVFAYAVLELCREGLLDLDSPLDGYLPSPCLPDDPRSGRITVRHVLSHTTGLPNWPCADKAMRTHFVPGERFSYSGAAYMLLQTVVERATGRPIASFLAERVLHPLGMEDSSFLWIGEEDAPLAVGHKASGESVEKEVWPRVSVAAGLHCSARDFAAFIRRMLRPPAKGAPRLCDRVEFQMQTPQVPVNDLAPWDPRWPDGGFEPDEHVSWGLGWGLGEGPSGPSFWHWGDNLVYRSFAIAYPSEGHGIVLMTNGANGHRVIRRVLLDLAGGSYPELDWIERQYGTPTAD